jgi:hypothetical protein
VCGNGGVDQRVGMGRVRRDDQYRGIALSHERMVHRQTVGGAVHMGEQAAEVIAADRVAFEPDWCAARKQ